MPKKMQIADKLHQPFVIEKIKGGHYLDGPLVVELDTTEVCNLACPGCISEDLVSNKTSFTRERLLEIGQELYDLGVKAVVLIGGGEPLAHPAVGELLSFFHSHDIRVGITTNGYYIPKYMDIIAESADWTRVSMDAATAETFMKLRPAKDGINKFDQIITGMWELGQRKKGKMGFSFLIRTEADGFGITSNIHEIYDAAVLARSLGCDYFEVKPSYSYSGGVAHALVIHDKKRMEEAKQEVDRLKELESDRFRITLAINLEDSLSCVSTPQKKEYHTCPSTQLRSLICPSGMYVCPYWRGKDPYRIGDPMHEHIADIWQGEGRKKIMDRLDPCVECDFHCLRNDTNNEVIRMLNTAREDIPAVEEYDRFL